MRYCPSRPTMFSDTPDVFGKDDDPLSWVFWTFTTGWWGGGGGKGVDRTGICPVENASEDGKGGPGLLGNMARKHQNWHQWVSKIENWKKKVSLWVETQKVQEIHIWIAERRTKKGPNALELHPWCWELRLMSALSELDKNFCLMASSPYGCFDWILQCKILTPSYDAWNALEVHTAAEIHTPLGIRENARSWLFDWSKPTDGATNLGQTPRTHCGVMTSKKCEGCHSLRLISWVAWQ